MSSLSLSLHLVAWNGAKYLPHLFASLREQTMQEWALVVVDNGSRDNTVAVLEEELSHFRTKMRKNIRVVCNQENRGFARGHNQAFGTSTCRHCESAKQSHALRWIGGGETTFRCRSEGVLDRRIPHGAWQVWGLSLGRPRSGWCRSTTSRTRNDDGGVSCDHHYIQLLNQDTVLAPDYLETLVKFLDAHPDVGAVQGALCRWDFAGDVRTDTIDTLGLRVRRTRQVIECGAGEPLTQFCTAVQNCVTPPEGAMEVFGVSGALPMYRMVALEDVALRRLEVGGGRLEGKDHLSPSNSPSPRVRGEEEEQDEIFDSTFFSYKEDVDLAYRLRTAGWKATCVPAARAWHDRTAGVHRTRRQRSAFERRLSWRNHLLMLIANEHPRTFTRDWWQIIGHELGKIAYIIVREPRTLAAAPSLFRLLPGAMRKRRGVMANYRAKAEEVGRWFGETNELRMDTNETNPTK